MLLLKSLRLSAKVKIGDQGLVFARVDSSTLGHYGNVDYTERLFDMIEAVKKSHESEEDERKGEIDNRN